eukprot:COSAG06_NODE_55925_length_287_cov_0.819149_1_plen_95_part_11
MPEHADELDDDTGSSFVALSRANPFQCAQQRGAQPTVARTARSHAEVVAAKQQQQQSRGADFFRDSLAKRRKIVSFSQSSQDDSTDEDEEDEEQD